MCLLAPQRFPGVSFHLLPQSSNTAKICLFENLNFRTLSEQLFLKPGKSTQQQFGHFKFAKGAENNL